MRGGANRTSQQRGARGASRSRGTHIRGSRGGRFSSCQGTKVAAGQKDSKAKTAAGPPCPAEAAVPQQPEIVVSK